MKKSLLKVGFFTVLTLLAANAFAQKKPWNEVKKPEITSIELNAKDPHQVIVNFNMLTSNDGADKGSVVMSGPKGKLVEAYGRTRREAKHVEFLPTASGEYTVTVYAERNGEKTKIESESKKFTFSLPLEKTLISTLNMGSGKVKVSWSAIAEAESYTVSYTDAAGKKQQIAGIQGLETTLEGLKIGQYSKISVAAIRGKESVSSQEINKLVKDEAERVWNFVWYGSSTSAETNNYEILDANDMKVRLNSCTWDKATGNIVKKGGKFTAYFDGISYYYTVIDPKKENFELTATVTVDFINPVADGQEGFGILASDSLGENEVNSNNFFTNSAGLLSWKYTTHVGGKKYEIKDGLGTRFVSGITKEVLAKGEQEITNKAKITTGAFSYDASDKIKTGDVYRITLKKDNTGFHTIYKRAIPAEDTVEEFIMYDSSKLCQIDEDHIYVGFVTARGCNATFSDVSFKVTDPKNDPPGLEEPPQLTILRANIESPTTWYNKKYPFKFSTNSNGTIRVETKQGKVLIKDEKIVVPNSEDIIGTSKYHAVVYYEKQLKLEDGINDLVVKFKPQDKWEPIPGQKPRTAIGQYNRETMQNEEDYKEVVYDHTVITKAYKGKTLYVSPDGTAFGNGQKDNPLDLQSALNYVMPGQTIILTGEKYVPKQIITIERGNDGTAKAPKTLKAEPGKRVIIDLSNQIVGNSTGSGFDLFGSWWIIEDIDITGSKENVKGMQIRGNHNIIRRVDAYMNNDTGIQISGASADPQDLWPSYNLIEACEAFGNADPAENNADGFGCKLTSGVGNVFRNCVAHHNVDDGWDLYAKVESGPIGAVLLDNCIAYSNGRRIDNSGSGDGNGFKLGGEGINVKHTIINSIAFNNDLNGITTNSNPGLIVKNCTAFGNKSNNITLYGKGKVSDDNPRTFELDNVLSFDGGEADNVRERPEVEDDTTYLFNGAVTQNKSKARLEAKDVFVSTDYSKYVVGINPDGTFNRIPRVGNQFILGDLFKLTDKAPKGIGADYNKSYASSNAK